MPGNNVIGVCLILISCFCYSACVLNKPSQGSAEESKVEGAKTGQLSVVQKLEKPADKFVRVYAAQAYKADLDQLSNTLIKVHPNALKFIFREAFWNAIEAKKALVTDKTTFSEFAWHCNEIIANVHCSHTGKGDFIPKMICFRLH